MPHSGTDRVYRLRRGRRLAYAEYGDRHGMPIIYCHGGLSSRLDIAFAHEPCRRAAVRLISIDRPGVGGSDPAPGRTLLDWPEDVRQLADALGLERLRVLGWSAGGPYALACGRVLADRIVRIGLVASLAPIDDERMIRELGLRADHVLYALARRAPAVAAAALRIARHLPAKTVRASLLRDLRSPSDRAILEAMSLRECTEIFFEALSRGAAGVVQDYRLTGGAWGFHPEDVTAEVVIWQGAEDNLVPPCQAELLAARLPRVRLIIRPERGHFLLRQDLREVLDTLAAAELPG